MAVLLILRVRLDPQKIMRIQIIDADFEIRILNNNIQFYLDPKLYPWIILSF
jgi:hypothetical protein